MAVPARGWAGPLLVGVAAILWGTVGIASKSLYGLGDVSPLVLGFLRLAIAVPLLLAWRWRSFGKWPFGFHGRDGVILVSIGAAMAIYQVCYFQAVADLGVVLTTLVTICSAPVLITLLSIIVLRERLTATVAVALGLGLVGTALLVGPQANGSASHATAGIAWAAGSALAYAIFVLSSRALARHDPANIIIAGFGLAALVLLPFAASVDFPPAWSLSAWSLLVYVGLVPTAAAYLLYFRGMRTTQAIPAGIIALLEPLTATLLAALLFDERIAWAGAVGIGFLVLSMLLLVLMRRPQPVTVGAPSAPPAENR